MSRELHPFLAALAQAGLYAPPAPHTRPRNGAAGHTPPPAGDPQASRYAAAALADETAIVAHTPQGSRNHQLNISAFRVGQLVALGWLPEHTAHTELVDAGMAAGLSHDEAERTVASGLGAGQDAPRDDVALHPVVAPAYTMPQAPDVGLETGPDLGVDRSADRVDSPTGPVITEPPGLAARILTRDQLAHLPQPSPLIADTLDLGAVTVLAGYWGTCKSFIAQDWAACVATGRPWQGRAVVQGSVLYVAAEGAHGLDARLSAWEAGWHRLIDADTFHVLPEPVHLGRLGDVAHLCEVIADHAYRLVVVDTLAKCMVGLDENSAQDMGRIVHALYLLRAATGDGAVLAVHHTGKDKTTVRGSSALEGGVDAVYATEGDPRLITLTRTKRKDGPTFDTHALTLSRVEYTDSAVIESASQFDLPQAQQELAGMFRSAFSETGASRSELRNASGMPPATFHRALNALVKTGRLVNDGTDQRPFYRAGTGC